MWEYSVVDSLSFYPSIGLGGMAIIKWKLTHHYRYTSQESKEIHP